MKRLPSLDDLDLTPIRDCDRERNRYTVAELCNDLHRRRSARFLVWTGATAIEVTTDFILGLLAEKNMIVGKHHWLAPYRISVPHPGYVVIQHQRHRRWHR